MKTKEFIGRTGKNLKKSFSKFKVGSKKNVRDTRKNVRDY